MTCWLQGLDYVVAMAPRYGIRLILTLTNFPPGYGGMEQYVHWFNGSSILEFYTNPDIVAAFRQYVQTVVTRVNSRTGVAYNEDPAILAWDIANEPQAPGDDSGDILQVRPLQCLPDVCVSAYYQVDCRGAR
jgi:mannan endo-1,4-beta-mannosidase